MEKTFLVIDGDEVLYKAGFASQVVEHYIRFSEDNIQGPFRTKALAVEWIGDDDAEEIYSKVVPFREDEARFRLNNIFKTILRDVNPTEYRIYLTGKGNFRFDISTVRPYKGNRDRSLRPYHYDYLKELLIDEWYAIEVDGMEADDALSISSWQHRQKGTSWTPIIGTQDKDLRMVPGYHYNPSNRELFQVDVLDARMNFYKQLLTGDNTDNIEGIYNMGASKAEKLLAPLKDASDSDIYKVILAEYDKAENNPVIASKMSGDIWGEERIVEIARLLWMLQEKEQLWEPRQDYYGLGKD